jgi:hypothetical protein
MVLVTVMVLLLAGFLCLQYDSKQGETILQISLHIRCMSSE